MRILLIIATLLLCAACNNRYYVGVYQQKVDGSSLASTGAGTPDPKQKHPPFGQMLVVEWQLPKDYLAQNPLVRLDVIYWDNVERSYVWPINDRKGYEILKILDEEYEKTGGILTYRARVMNEEGEIYREWRHMMWVHLITLD
jgi:hypothetical protein